MDLARHLRITPQALHRHLNALIKEGLIEKRGRPPVTRYSLADAPDFGRAKSWFLSLRSPRPADEVCETRDVFSGRLSRLRTRSREGVGPNELSLIIAISGEIGNNSFDHNLGQWRDVPGCWFEHQIRRGILWILIADRGQGIWRSLTSVAPEIGSDQEELDQAFSVRITGRAPEKRGNGLKYVKQVINGGPGRGLACRSGAGLLSFGEMRLDCEQVMGKRSGKMVGTITLCAWRIGL